MLSFLGTWGTICWLVFSPRNLWYSLLTRFQSKELVTQSVGAFSVQETYNLLTCFHSWEHEAQSATNFQSKKLVVQSVDAFSFQGTVCWPFILRYLWHNIVTNCHSRNLWHIMLTRFHSMQLTSHFIDTLSFHDKYYLQLTYVWRLFNPPHHHHHIHTHQTYRIKSTASQHIRAL